MAAVEDYQGEDCGCHCARIVHLSIRAMKPGTYILIGVGLAVAVLLGFLVGQRCPRNGGGETPTPKVDTLVIRDTFKVTEPIYVTKRVVDSIPYPVTDTLRMRDTLYVILEREQIRWEDSLSVVYASGVMPQVDSVIHHTESLIITKEIPVIKKTRWGLGVQAGVGAGKGGLTPYVGVGVSYNLLSW
jgi:hypothetical protein